MSMSQQMKNIFSKFLGKKQEEPLNSSGNKTGMHGNYYVLSEEDRIKAEEVKRINREIKKRKALRDAYIEKLLDDKEIAMIKKDIANIHGEDEENSIDKVMFDTITNLMQGQGINLPNGINTTTPNANEDFYSDEIIKEANRGIEELEQEKENLEVSRFTDEEIEKNLPKLLNDTQIKYISQLSEGELLQVYDVIKKKKAL